MTTPAQIASTLRVAARICQSNGVRWTEKRERILAILLGSEAPQSAYSIAALYKESCGENIKPMSVYRILDFLVQEHLVHRINLANKYVACRQIQCCQEHGVSQFLICTKCEKVQEIVLPDTVMADLSKTVMDNGFALEQSHLEFASLCNECSGQANFNTQTGSSSLAYSVS